MQRKPRKNLTRPRKKTVKTRNLRRDGKQLKSNLETYCYDHLKETDGFRYPGIYYKSTKAKDYMMNATGNAVLQVKYTPDFVSHKHKFIIETKGYVPSQHTFPIRWKMFLKYLVDNGMEDYMLFIPKNKKQVDETIQTIRREIRNSQ
jgi:hypothetical protein